MLFQDIVYIFPDTKHKFTLYCKVMQWKVEEIVAEAVKYISKSKAHQFLVKLDVINFVIFIIL